MLMVPLYIYVDLLHPMIPRFIETFFGQSPAEQKRYSHLYEKTSFLPLMLTSVYCGVGLIYGYLRLNLHSTASTDKRKMQ